jgi:DNA-binding MarR family transcriptional regulator
MDGRGGLDALQQAREQGIGRLLLLARQDFLERLQRKMRARGGADYLPGMARLLPYLPVEGVRGVELARRLGVTKQAAGRLVGELEAAGLLRREPDPADGRAWLVRFTPAGLRYVVRMHRLIADIERDYDRAFGERAMRIVRETLAGIAYGEAAVAGAPEPPRRSRRG